MCDLLSVSFDVVDRVAQDLGYDPAVLSEVDLMRHGSVDEHGQGSATDSCVLDDDGQLEVVGGVLLVESAVAEVAREREGDLLVRVGLGFELEPLIDVGVGGRGDQRGAESESGGSVPGSGAFIEDRWHSGRVGRILEVDVVEDDGVGRGGAWFRRRRMQRRDLIAAPVTLLGIRDCWAVVEFVGDSVRVHVRVDRKVLCGGGHREDEEGEQDDDGA